MISLNANGSADQILASAIELTTSSANSMTININATGGLGDVLITGGLTVGTAWGATSLDINASASLGSFQLVASAFAGIMVVDLGNDVGSANMVRAGTGADKLYGGSNGDNFNGGAGADTIYGYAGNDTIEGGVGSDVLYGGEGSDNFHISWTNGVSASFSAVQGTGFFDKIMDWGSGDMLYFSGATAFRTWTATTAFNSISVATSTLIGAVGDGSQSATSGLYLSLYQNGGDTYIEITYDALTAGTTNELGSAVYRVVLDGVSGWTAISGNFTFSLTSSGFTIASV